MDRRRILSTDQDMHCLWGRLLQGQHQRKESRIIRETLREFCIRTGQIVLLHQWCQAENRPLTPDAVSSGSNRRIWWQCEKGHRWQATVYSRTGAGTHCPFCAGKVPVPGETDLASRFPALVKEWNREKNAPLVPEQVLPGSHKLVWWQCEKGHQWQAMVKSRAGGAGCPVCTNRQVIAGENDLDSTYPALAAEWHPEKNGAFKPEQVTAGSHKRVWWRCGKGHVWRAAIFSRANGTGCPVCAGKMVASGENDLQNLFPEVAREWIPEKNGTISPRCVSPYSNRRVWWRCEKGHEYQAAIAARTMHSSGCPYCTGRKVLPGFNDLATAAPGLAAQWHGDLNGNLTPSMVTAGSHRKVWWQCDQGHVWRAVIYSRTGAQQCGCPVCAGRVKKRRFGAARHWEPEKL